MVDYRMSCAPDDDKEFTEIYATHPAQPGTYIVYAHRDGTSYRTPVILWGVVANGSPEPITLGGVWDETEANNNKFILFPDGRCHTYDQAWETLEEAIAEMGKKE